MINSNLINFLFLTPLFIIGVFCSYTDIKYKKIFNNWIIFGFIYVFFLYSFLFLKIHSNLFDLILNGLISLIAGYSLWHFKFWSAGDAKLFTLYSFLIPLNFYSKSYVPYFPSFNLLMNLFVPFLFLIIISALITLLKSITELRVENFKKIKLDGINKLFIYLFNLFLNYFFVFIILQSIIIPITDRFLAGEIFKNPFFIFAILLLTINNFHKARKEIKKLNFILYSVIFFYLFFIVVLEKDLILLMSVLKITFVFMIFIGITRTILNFYIEKNEINMVKVKDIKEGMLMVNNNESFFNEKIKEDLGVMDPGGLTKKQIKMIKNLFKGKEDLKIKIYKTFPFAPFLFLSAVISILTRNSFLSLIDMFFNYLL